MEKISIILAVFIVSVLGSLHCASMCGPIVMSLGRGNRYSIAAYQSGRLLAYLGLGLVAGALGYILPSSELWNLLAQLLGISVGLIIVFIGILNLFQNQGQFHLLPYSLQRPLHRLGEKITGSNNSSFVLGLASALIPCGWLWVFVLGAVGLADPFLSPMVLFTFWLGNLPILTGLHILKDSNHFSRKLRSHLTSFGLIICGLLLVFIRGNQIGSLVAKQTRPDPDTIFEYIFDQKIPAHSRDAICN